MSRASTLLGGLTATGAGCVAYGCLIERRWYRLRHQPVPGVLRRGGQLRLLHVSDLHLSPGQGHRVEFLRGLADLPYDVVVATGDLLGAPRQERRTAEALAALTADGRPGVVVLGSNDFYGPMFKRPWKYFTEPGRRVHGEPLETDRFVALLKGFGYRTLRGGTETIATPAGDVVFAGLDDPHLAETLIPDPEVLAAPPRSSAIAHIGAVHAPYRAALEALVRAGHDLLLAGHTHGGQVRLPGIGALTTNCDLPLDRARGLSRLDGAWLHVSAGLGHSPYAPFRFACRPEATLLTLEV